MRVFPFENRALGGAWSQVGVLPESPRAHTGVRELAGLQVAFTIGRGPGGSFQAGGALFNEGVGCRGLAPPQRHPGKGVASSRHQTNGSG